MPTTLLKKLLHFSTPLVALIAVLLLVRTESIQAQADVTPPTTTYVQTPSSPDGNNNWYVSDVQFDLTGTDLESGVKEINYRIDGGAWQTVSFTETMNLAPNPSFEIPGATSTGAESWEASVADPESVFTRDTTDYAPGYSTASVKMLTSGGSWHGIHHRDNYIPAIPYDNMTASVWMKIIDVPGQSKFRVYAVLNDDSVVELAESSKITGTTDWVKISLDFVVNNSNAKGVYIDIGHTGPGTLFVDAVSITSSLFDTSTTVTIGSDSANHTLEFYSVDNANNAETSSCVDPKSNCVEFKLDQTPPGNWYDSGAYRQTPGPSDHHLFVYTNVMDDTSGLSTSTSQYKYQTDFNPGEFGSFSDTTACSSTWQIDTWTSLGEGVSTDGVNDAHLETQLTDFCDSDWKVCKTVRFYAEDMAGNTREKDYCINGPWVRFRGGGIVRSNQNIDMLSAADEENTDGLIELTGNLLDFFTSTEGWIVKGSPVPPAYDYDRLWRITDEKTSISTSDDLISSTGVYVINGDYDIVNAKIPNNYNTATFDQIVFVDGNLRISNNIEVSDDSTALFVVKGNVEVDKQTNDISVGILADGEFFTAYNKGVTESVQQLILSGLFSAERIYFQRILQGTNNERTPSEDFIYEPKYLIQQKDLFSSTATLWRYDQ